MRNHQRPNSAVEKELEQKNKELVEQQAVVRQLREEIEKEKAVKMIYLLKKLNDKQRRACGLLARKVDVPVKSLELAPLYPEIEQELFAVQLIHPKGDYNIWVKNDNKWMAVFNPFLIDKVTMLSINEKKFICSELC